MSGNRDAAAIFPENGGADKVSIELARTRGRRTKNTIRQGDHHCAIGAAGNSARDRIYDDFIRLCRPAPHDTILDVGVSDVVNDAANMLERKYPYPDRITALGLGRGDEFRASVPRWAALPERQSAFPFCRQGVRDRGVEHDARLYGQHFADPEDPSVAELMRVARTVFISVPNRY